MVLFKEKTFETEWEFIQPLQWKLLNQERISKSDWNDLIYRMQNIHVWDDHNCTNVDLLWEASKNEIDRLLILVLNRISSHADQDAMVRSYIEEWNIVFTQLNYLKLVYETGLGYGNSSNRTNPGVLIRDIILYKWYSDILKNREDQLIDYAMLLIEKERKGDNLNSNTIKGISESLISLSMYSGVDEPLYNMKYLPLYLKNTEIYYQFEGSQCLSSDGLLEYMKYVEKKINEENLRATRYLRNESEVKLCYVELLIENPICAFLEECGSYFKSESFVPLHLMYQILSKSPMCIPELILKFESYMTSYGLKCVKELDNTTKDAEKYVDVLLTLLNTYNQFLTRSFNNNALFQTTLDKSFTCIVNDTTVFSTDNTKDGSSSTSPKLIASYFDILLRVTSLSKRLTSEEIDSKLANLCKLLEYVSNKDIFIKYHKIHLMKRLILETTTDNDKEEKIIASLKECGMPANDLKQLYTMIQDMKVSSDLSRELNKKNLKIKILTHNMWTEGSKAVECVIPAVLESQLTDIQQFYKNMHATRKLLFYHHMGTGTMTLNSNVGSYDLELTVLQIITMTTFSHNPMEKLSFEFLNLTTGIPDGELRKILWSLTGFAKLKRQVILTEPSATGPKDFTSDSKFWINMDFALVNKNKTLRNRGKVNLIGKYNVNTDFSEDNDIKLLRRLRIQEAVMTVLKTRKRIHFSNLQLEVINILKGIFFATTGMIEEQIRKLILDEQVTRDENDNDIFVYIA